MKTLFKKNGLALLLALTCSQFAYAETVTLDGSGVTPANINAIAQGAGVAIDDKAKKRAEDSFDVLLQAAKTGQKIYGFTVGVGWNKDKTFVNAEGLFWQPG